MAEYDDGLYQWNEAKAGINLLKHGVDFAEARSVFRDPEAVSFLDVTHSDNEDRWITVGFSERGRILTVVSTDRGPRIRIISARKAGRSEENSYVARRSR